VSSFHDLIWAALVYENVLIRTLVPPISSSYSGCGKLVKELEIEKRH